MGVFLYILLTYVTIDLIHVECIDQNNLTALEDSFKTVANNNENELPNHINDFHEYLHRVKRCIVVQKQSGTHGDSSEDGGDSGEDDYEDRNRSRRRRKSYRDDYNRKNGRQSKSSMKKWDSDDSTEVK